MFSIYTCVYVRVHRGLSHTGRRTRVRVAHQELEMLETEPRGLAHVVHQPARCRNQDVHSAGGESAGAGKEVQQLCPHKGGLLIVSRSHQRVGLSLKSCLADGEAH